MTDFDQSPPHDIGAEQAVIGAMLLSPEAVAKVAEILARDDFYRPSHQKIYERMLTMRRDGIPVDAETTRVELENHGEFSGGFKPTYLIDLIQACPAVTSADYYARTVAAKAGRRRALETLARAEQQLRGGTSLAEVVERAAFDLTTEARLADVEQAVTAVELDDLLAATEDTAFDWIIPGFLERGDRFILTGTEGSGKSTLLRQIGIQAASGMHPFTGEAMNPLCVLQVDLENSEAQSRRELRPLRLAAGAHYRTGHFHLRSRPEGMDLTSQNDREWLRRLGEAINPDLLIIGPLYKMANGSPIEEESAKPVAVTLDTLRVQLGCGLLIEAHAPKTMQGTRRAIEPYGWSGWLRWPEFGFHIDKDGHLTPWRGQRDAERHIPAALQRGGAWPWSPLTRPRDVLWSRIAENCAASLTRPSIRELAGRLSVSKASVERAIAEHRAEWDALGGSQ